MSINCLLCRKRGYAESALGGLGWSGWTGLLWGEGHRGPGSGQRVLVEFAAAAGGEVVELEGVPEAGVLFTVEDGRDLPRMGARLR